MAALETSTMLIGQAQTGLASQIGEIKAIVQVLDGKLDNLLERLATEHAEPRATAAGRALSDRIAAIESPLSAVNQRVDSLESSRDELRGVTKSLQVVALLSSVLSTVAFVVSILHGFKVI